MLKLFHTFFKAIGLLSIVKMYNPSMLGSSWQKPYLRYPEYDLLILLQLKTSVSLFQHSKLV